jgi:predicted nucleic acid-binding protein
VIFVDSSVWIAHLRGHRTAATAALEAAAGREPLLLGDLVLLEVLQGARDEAHAIKLEIALRRFRIVPLLAEDLAVKAARNDRTLREAGVTVRKTVDIVIGTYCIELDHTLLHDDRDFAPMAAHLGLKEFPQ